MTICWPPGRFTTASGRRLRASLPASASITYSSPSRRPDRSRSKVRIISPQAPCPCASPRRARARLLVCALPVSFLQPALELPQPILQRVQQIFDLCSALAAEIVALPFDDLLCQELEFAGHFPLRFGQHGDLFFRLFALLV